MSIRYEPPNVDEKEKVAVSTKYNLHFIGWDQIDSRIYQQATHEVCEDMEDEILRKVRKRARQIAIEQAKEDISSAEERIQTVRDHLTPRNGAA